MLVLSNHKSDTVFYINRDSDSNSDYVDINLIDGFSEKQKRINEILNMIIKLVLAKYDKDSII